MGSRNKAPIPHGRQDTAAVSVCHDDGEARPSNGTDVADLGDDIINAAMGLGASARTDDVSFDKPDSGASGPGRLGANDGDDVDDDSGSRGGSSSGDEVEPIDLAEQEVFKGNVKRYIELSDQLTAKAKETSLLKKQKNDVRDSIMQFMRRYEVEQCVSESSKLVIATTKSSQPVNRNYITSFLTSSLGTDAAVKMVELMWSSRQVTTKDTLKRTKLNDKQLERIRNNT